jgi:[lysine-biosynthesis-protein LysW]--L-2-aminoadipate ligase
LHNYRAMVVALIAHKHSPTNVALARNPGVEIVPPADALRTLGEGDIAVGRLDVAEHLDGIEVGLWELARLEGEGIRVLNRPGALVAAHDKLATSRALAATGVRHPATAHVTTPSFGVPIHPPVVVKPRFGSWGRDVMLCQDVSELRRCLTALSRRPWFQAQGALVQELVPPLGHDLRLVVAGGTVVGAVRRVAAAGEWRTNVALGAIREPVAPPPEAVALALAAAGAIEADLVGVDLLPTPDGSFIVLELNGAVEFNHQYTLDGDVFDKTLAALLLAAEPATAVA